MTITITAYDWVPDMAKGYVRDLRVRWALEEVGERYAVRTLSWGEQKGAAHRALQPFGQVPTLEEDGLALFESAAIVHYVADTRAGLLPADRAARARAIGWMYAAVNSVEPFVMDHAVTAIFEADQPWSATRLPIVDDRIRERLRPLAERLSERDWLDGAFSAADLLMVCVLRDLTGQPLLAEFPAIAAYVARGEARPAFARALAAQLADFTGTPPQGVTP